MWSIIDKQETNMFSSITYHYIIIKVCLFFINFLLTKDIKMKLKRHGDPKT